MSTKILVIDDNEEFNFLLAEVFSQAGFQVGSYLQPREALEAIQSERYQLVVTDYAMPGMKGVEVVRRVKQIDAEVPVILISGALNADQIDEVKVAGADDVILKPFNVFELIEKGEALIRN